MENDIINFTSFDGETLKCVIGDVNWVAVVSASALAGLLSLLTSVAGLPEASNEN